MPSVTANQTLPWLLSIAGASFALAVVATFVTRFVAQRVGFVAKPRAERWSQRPTALAGGAGIFIGFLGPTLVAGGHLRLHLLAGATAMFALGLVDDVFRLKPYTKLIGQLAVAALTIATGSLLPWTGVLILNQAVSLFWIIGITNALNLLDNMDGLAGGVACLASIFQAIFFVLQHEMPEAACATALAGAVAGFLVFNRNPASIFMGDCGALFLGYALATLAMEQDYGRSRGLLATVAVPVLVMLVPIFDTTFVTLVRVLRGRPISRGGRDHTSHRLVLLGLSEKTAVRTLLGIGALSGTIAVLARVGVTTGVWVCVPLLIMILAFLGIHLARTDRPDAVNPSLLLAVATFGHRRRLFEVLVDAVLAMVALVGAFLLRFDGNVPPDTARDVARVFLVVVATKLVVLYFARAYEGVWRYSGVRDLMNLARGAALASVCTVIVVGIWIRFGALSRGALIVDGLLFTVLVMASRISFRVLRVVLGGAVERTKGGVRVILWGAGDLGEQLARRLLDNPEEGFLPVAFVDDDPLKIGRLIHGLPVRGGGQNIPELLGAGLADVAIVTTSRIPPDRATEVALRAGAHRVRRVKLVLEDVVHGSPSSLPPS